MSPSLLMDDKENLAPQLSSDLLLHGSSSFSPIKAAASRRGRSKSIGPGGLDEVANSIGKDSRQEAKNRRKSTYVPATKAIISADAEKTARQAARRKTLANRRVSFAPEATLHTWDVVEFMRDQTTSTDSSGDTWRRSSVPHNHETSSDAEDEDLLSSPAKTLPTTKKRRSSGIPPLNFNNPDDAGSSSEISSGSEVSGSEDEQEDEGEAGGSPNVTDTAMNLDNDEGTLVSQSSDGTSSSTGSSARLDASLRLAAEQAGTRGIDYDEHGDGDMDEDVSMELADDAITNAFQPWAAHAGLQLSFSTAATDQENINPFSPAFKADMMSLIEEEETGDMSMEVTKAVGNILKTQSEKERDSSSSDAAMDVTQTVGSIRGPHEDFPQDTRESHKRRRTTSEAGSPGAITFAPQSSKLRRSSAARSSMGDDTMDLTLVVGGIQNISNAPQVGRRRSMRRRSSGVVSEQADATMEFTQAVGSIKNNVRTDHTGSSFDENEELTMESTTVLGGTRGAHATPPDACPVTPEDLQSAMVDAANTTPKDQERFTDMSVSGPRTLLTPLLQQQITDLDDARASSPRRKSVSPTKHRSRRTTQVTTETKDANEVSILVGEEENGQNMYGVALPMDLCVTQSAVRIPRLIVSDGEVQVQLDTQSKEIDRQSEASPAAAKQLRGSPVKPAVASPTAYRQYASNSAGIGPATLASPGLTYISPSHVFTAKPTPVTPDKVTATPEHIDVPRTIAESIRLMNTPYRESLKVGTPRKQTQLNEASPQRLNISGSRSTSRAAAPLSISPTAQVANDLGETQTEVTPAEKIHLQTFLEMAQIRFMDLTTTKRRMTTAATPSKMQKFGGVGVGVGAKISLDGAVVASACTTPELEMYRHACHELKHYISDGKKVIKQLENETYRKTPPLLRAYVQACQQLSSHPRRQAIDAQMRDMKTHARLRSKELWYVWRTQLLEDLVKALSGIAEGLIKDDEIVRDLEEIVGEALPGLMNKQQTLSSEAHQLEQAAVEVPEEDKVDIQAARKNLLHVSVEVERKQKLLDDLRDQDLRYKQSISEMLESKSEFDGAIEEAERVREACRGVSSQEIASLKDSIMSLEETYGWSITSAETSPQTVTMTYKSQLQLYFHPSSFNIASQQSYQPRPNAPIRLNYIVQAGKQESRDLTTTLRFFHQFLRASLQALPQYATRIPDLLNLIGGGWDTALSVAEAERRLSLETLTTSRIVSDERLAIESVILLPAVRTKVLVAFELFASIGGDEPGDTDLALNLTIEPSAAIIYGQSYNEGKMTKAIIDRIDGVCGWDVAAKELREQLIVHGAKKGTQS